jgi:hypothetical protein
LNYIWKLNKSNSPSRALTDENRLSVNSYHLNDINTFLTMSVS